MPDPNTSVAWDFFFNILVVMLEVAPSPLPRLVEKGGACPPFLV
jgi:hypothetical protein